MISRSESVDTGAMHNDRRGVCLRESRVQVTLPWHKQGFSPVCALEAPLEGLRLSDWGLTMDQLELLAACSSPVLLKDSCPNEDEVDFPACYGSPPSFHTCVVQLLQDNCCSRFHEVSARREDLTVAEVHGVHP